MHKLIEYACDELEDLEKKIEKGGDLTANEVEYAKTLAKLKHYLKEDDEMEGEYSGAMYDDGMSYERGGNRGGSYRGTYRGSYARNGRGRGSRAKRDSMGRYSSEGYSREGGNSYADDVESVKDEIRDLAMELPEQHRRKIERAVDGMM